MLSLLVSRLAIFLSLILNAVCAVYILKLLSLLEIHKIPYSVTESKQFDLVMLRCQYNNIDIIKK